MVVTRRLSHYELLLSASPYPTVLILATLRARVLRRPRDVRGTGNCKPLVNAVPPRPALPDPARSTAECVLRKGPFLTLFAEEGPLLNAAEGLVSCRPRRGGWGVSPSLAARPGCWRISAGRPAMSGVAAGDRRAPTAPIWSGQDPAPPNGSAAVLQVRSEVLDLTQRRSRGNSGGQGSRSFAGEGRWLAGWWILDP